MDDILLTLETWFAFVGDAYGAWVLLPIVAILGVNPFGRGAVPAAAGGPQSVSSFQAFAISAASRVGTGNLHHALRA